MCTFSLSLAFYTTIISGLRGSHAHTSSPTASDSSGVVPHVARRIAGGRRCLPGLFCPASVPYSWLLLLPGSAKADGREPESHLSRGSHFKLDRFAVPIEFFCADARPSLKLKTLPSFRPASFSFSMAILFSQSRFCCSSERGEKEKEKERERGA
jgi:hypothetical protein